MIGSHVLLGFTQGFARRETIARIIKETPPLATIHALDLQRLQQEGIQALALDFDGVLAHHGADYPQSDAVNWLRQTAHLFGEDKIFILSNKPTEQRRAWFAEHFPGIRFISGVAKKPNPDGLKKIGELASVPLTSILMIDDRLLTGCLAALNAGSRPCWINQPSVSFSSRPFAELFFMFLRASERLFIRLIS